MAKQLLSKHHPVAFAAVLFAACLVCAYLSNAWRLVLPMDGTPCAAGDTVRVSVTSVLARWEREVSAETGAEIPLNAGYLTLCGDERVCVTASGGDMDSLEALLSGASDAPVRVTGVVRPLTARETALLAQTAQGPLPALAVDATVFAPMGFYLLFAACLLIVAIGSLLSRRGRRENDGTVPDGPSAMDATEPQRRKTP